MSLGYLGNDLRPGDSQPITKLVPVSPHCGEVTLPEADTEHDSVSLTNQKRLNNKRRYSRLRTLTS